MKNLLLVTCLGLASVWPSIALAQETPAYNAPVEVPRIEVPVIEAPLAPLVPSPYGAGNVGDKQAGGENSLVALQAKIAELEQRITADRTLVMRQQMTRLRTIDQRLEEMARQISELGVRPAGDAELPSARMVTPPQTADPFADPAKAAGMRLRLSTIEEVF